ncbi:response regulator [Pedobacter sp. BS3]|uniref:response regulator n=1 Tax=Pedobacter sp. BS3 TaxID=2567937 RepID=UPI001659AE8D|nr:response regulator [Pedobacter sp. BS3]
MKKKILIIDDDNRNIFALRLTLRSKGYECLSAQSAQAGIDILAQDKNIGIILMDMMMPDMDGYQAMAVLHKNPETTHIPVIAVTAQAMVGDREKCLRAGATDYIAKPIDVDVLLEILKRYL